MGPPPRPRRHNGNQGEKAAYSGGLFAGTGKWAVQQADAAVQLSAGNGDDPVGGPPPLSDAAGVQEQGLSPPVHQGAVGVAEEEQVQILLLGGKTGGSQRLLDAVGVAVTHQNAEILQAQQPLRRLVGAEVAVAGHLLEGDLGKAPLELLAVPPAVPQMEDQVGIRALHGPLHGLDGPVGIGKYQYLHRIFVLSFHIASIHG